MAELVRRYVVMPLATAAPFDPADPDGVFVLKPWKDPAALRALRAYRDSCFPELRRDLDAWIRAIEAGPVVRGDVGRRNEPFAPAARAPGTTPVVAGKNAPIAPGRKRAKTKTAEPRPATRAKPAPAPRARPLAARRRGPKKPARKRRR
jgi:hypothetical protein